MPTLTNSIEGVTPSGTTLTALVGGNTGGTSGSFFDNIGITAGGVIASDSAHAAHGTLGVKISNGATAGATRCEWSTSLGTITQGWFRAYLYLTANPATTFRVASFFSTGTFGGGVAISTAGKLQCDAATAGLTTSTAAIPLNAWFRIEGFVLCSATVGQVEVKLFTSPDSGTAAETNTTTAAQNTQASVNTLRLGIANAIASVGPFWMDDVGVSTTGYLGPSVAAAAVPDVVMAPMTGA